jgi:hypothetical protein
VDDVRESGLKNVNQILTMRGGCLSKLDRGKGECVRFASAE